MTAAAEIWVQVSPKPALQVQCAQRGWLISAASQGQSGSGVTVNV